MYKILIFFQLISRRTSHTNIEFFKLFIWIREALFRYIRQLLNQVMNIYVVLKWKANICNELRTEAYKKGKNTEELLTPLQYSTRLSSS